MRSASPDLTARARIRDAAIQAFARDGFDAASMRAIAADAGVSAALIVHHFGDKNALREACDDHVVAMFLDEKHEFIGVPRAERIRAALHDAERFGPYVDYLARMLSDRTPAADRLFDAIVDLSRNLLHDQREAGMLVEMSDPDMTAILIAMMGLGPVLLRAQFARALGADQLTPEGLARTTLPTMELLTHGIYRTSDLLDGTRAAMGLPETPPETPEEES